MNRENKVFYLRQLLLSVEELLMGWKLIPVQSYIDQQVVFFLYTHINFYYDQTVMAIRN